MEKIKTQFLSLIKALLISVTANFDLHENRIHFANGKFGDFFETNGDGKFFDWAAGDRSRGPLAWLWPGFGLALAWRWRWRSGSAWLWPGFGLALALALALGFETFACLVLDEIIGFYSILF